MIGWEKPVGMKIAGKRPPLRSMIFSFDRAIEVGSKVNHIVVIPHCSDDAKGEVGVVRRCDRGITSVAGDRMIHGIPEDADAIADHNWPSIKFVGHVQKISVGRTVVAWDKW